MITVKPNGLIDRITTLEDFHQFRELYHVTGVSLTLEDLTEVDVDKLSEEKLLYVMQELPAIVAWDLLGAYRYELNQRVVDILKRVSNQEDVIMLMLTGEMK